jgi:hypothetical protein
VALERPRVRNASKLGFESRVLGKGVTRTHALESLVISSFLRGLSTESIDAQPNQSFDPTGALHLGKPLCCLKQLYGRQYWAVAVLLARGSVDELVGNLGWPVYREARHGPDLALVDTCAGPSKAASIKPQSYLAFRVAVSLGRCSDAFFADERIIEELVVSRVATTPGHILDGDAS